MNVRQCYPINSKYALQKHHPQWSSKVGYPMSVRRQKTAFLSAGDFSKDPLTLIPNICGCSDCFSGISSDLGSVARYSDGAFNLEIKIYGVFLIFVVRVKAEIWHFVEIGYLTLDDHCG